MGVNRMTGTPWHVEVLGSGDRRHRSRCSYYCNNSQFCRYYDETCRGSAHCSKYDEYVTAEERKNTHRHTTKHGDYSVTVVTSYSGSVHKSSKTDSRSKDTSLGKSFSSVAKSVNSSKISCPDKKSNCGRHLCSVRGALQGNFHLVLYSGKLSQYTDKKTEAMFVPVTKNGKNITIPISVVRNDRLMFIFETHYRKYELELGKPDGILVLKTPKG